MVQNAQSDNEKAALVYQVELFKDRMEDMEEAYGLLQVMYSRIEFAIQNVFFFFVFSLIIRKSTVKSIKNVKKPKEKRSKFNKS